MKNKREVTLDEIRTVQLGILNKIHEFCVKNNIRYSLCGGTLLGAVRHKGYIPWDDDVDIFMPRPDYERFFASFNGNYDNVVAQCYLNDQAIFYYYGKVYDSRTIMIENDLCRTGVYIDVFPIDGMPNTVEEAEQIRHQTYLFSENLKHTTKYHEIDGRFSSFVKYYLKVLFYPSRRKTINEYHDLISRYKFDESEYAGVYYTRYGLRERLNSNVFKTFIDMPFEGVLYKCIADYDTYLTSLYGDYMKLPPPEKRVSHHPHKAYWK